MFHITIKTDKSIGSDDNHNLFKESEVNFQYRNDTKMEKVQDKLFSNSMIHEEHTYSYHSSVFFISTEKITSNISKITSNEIKENSKLASKDMNDKTCYDFMFGDEIYKPLSDQSKQYEDQEFESGGIVTSYE